MPRVKEIYTKAEWLQRARELFGDDPNEWAFVCPVCGHVAKAKDWRALGAHNAIAFSCVGRWMDECREAFREEGRPCNYAGGGLFRLNPVRVVDADGREHEVFAFAETA